jgi:hypothetical protein
MKSAIGKFKGVGLIRTKDGIPRVKDMNELDPALKEMIQQEIADKYYTLADIESAQRELEAIA